MQTSTPTRSALSRFLTLVEHGGNALPHPATLFAAMAAVVILVSALTTALGVSVVRPGTGEVVRPVNLVSLAGLHRILTEMVTNFTGFTPLGTVLVALLGIAIAEGSGLIAAALKLVVLTAPRRLLTTAIVFAGVMSNTGGEVGYVLLVPLAAVVFAGVGRHPVAGRAAVGHMVMTFEGFTFEARIKDSIDVLGKED
jgi:aminobenzoyl-glutamate transport protein